MQVTMDDDDLHIRNTAISHAVYLYSRNPRARSFWELVYEIEGYLRTGNMMLGRQHAKDHGVIKAEYPPYGPGYRSKPNLPQEPVGERFDTPRFEVLDTD